ncbi:MAG TPA: ammonium transporter [Actinomycetota bacterium]|jgi:ammonium transporter, Amt family|nr:ammonium transporter [Actinomycetota bacterium]
MDTGDTAFVLVSAALVMFMTPGLALFYGGMVRAKNVLGTLMQSVFALGLVSVLWVLIGYTLAFGPDKGGLIGGLDFLGLRGVGADPNPDLAGTIPHTTFALFQMMFAVITPALITGAFAERMKFSAYALFTAVWLLLVYAPVAHWVWAPGGWIREMGALDFAGGTVVHINAGVAALAAAVIIGRRRGFGKQAVVPHNLTMTLLGTGILWFGWFGFNAGSALGANGLASSAFLATHLGAAAGACGWALYEATRERRPTTLGVASGAVAGLVAITPAAGFVSPLPAIAIGLCAGIVCAVAVRLKFRFGLDDSLDVVGVHLAGGIVGALLTGVFADLAVNGAGADGLLNGGGAALLGKQVVAVGATFAFSLAVSAAILKIVDLTVGLRVSSEEEASGLDLSQHAEVGYAFSESGGAIEREPERDVPAPSPVAAVPVPSDAR